MQLYFLSQPLNQSNMQNSIFSHSLLKSTLLTCIFFSLILKINAQAPLSIPYQAVARNTSGNIIANQLVSLRFSLHDLTAGGVVVYRETQTITTNSLGLFNVNIGQGIVVTGTFAGINWSSGSKFLQVELDAAGGVNYTNMGTQQMFSVPYALYANTSGISSSSTWTANGTDIYNSNSGNVGIGINSPAAKLHVVGSKAYFQTGFVGIGTNTATTPFTGLALKNNVNNFYGMYIDAGATGQPFYGYALNGVATAYHQFNGSNNQYEYFHSNPAIPDFQIGNTNSAFPNTSFLGIGTTTQTTPFTGLALKKNVNAFYGMYIDAGATGQPFYGYALNGIATAYHQFNGTNNQYEYYHSSASVPDFQIGNTNSAFPNTSFLGIGTTTQTTPFTGLALKKNVNTYYGMYIDAGATGQPFYGYALNGVATAYHQFNGDNNQYEYYHSNVAVPDFQIGNTQAAFPNTNFLGIGTTTPTTSFTGLALKTTANSFYGTYVDAGPTGVPFYGYALNGVARSYLSFNSPNSSLEYHQTSDASADFYINGNSKAVFNTNFVGIGTSTPTTGFTGFAMKTLANSFYGSYVDAGPTGIPFYGYALNGVASAYTTYNGSTNQFEYHHTSDATPDFAVSNTQASFPIQTTLTVGTSNPFNSFTGLTLKKNVNGFYGTYVDAGATGTPFYGFGLNGVSKAYLAFNATNNALEYHQTSDASPDFYINGNSKAVFNTNFVGIGTSTPTTGFTGFAMKTSANSFYGSYVDAGPTGVPFYGYALNGVATAYTTYNGNTNQFEYHHTSDATPDFAVSNTDVVFPIQTFLGLGTSSPTTSATGFAMRNNVNSYYGMYVDVGASGRPFYGYALNGVAKAWTEFNGTNNNWELNYSGARISVTSSGNVGIGTSAPAQKLSVAGNICYTGSSAACSDIRYKKNITPLSNAMMKVLKMQGVQYMWRVNEFPDKQFSDAQQIGFIAQDIEKICPELVVTDADGYKSVDYSKVTPLLVEAIKELQAENDHMKLENEQIKQQHADIEQSMNSLQQSIQALEAKLNLIPIKNSN